jgi:hypothetical protein
VPGDEEAHDEGHGPEGARGPGGRGAEEQALLAAVVAGAGPDVGGERVALGGAQQRAVARGEAPRSRNAGLMTSASRFSRT